MPAVRAPRRAAAPPPAPAAVPETPAPSPAPVAAPPIPLSPDPGPRRAKDLDGFDYLASLSPGEWDERIVYLYRQEPNVIKSDDRSKKFIAKISHNFDEEWVRAQFGGGRFLAIVKNQRNGSGDAERKFSFEIEGAPRLQADEKYRDAANPAQPGAPAPSAQAFDSAAIVRAVGDVLADARAGRDPDEDALARITETMRQGSAAAIEVIKSAAMERAGSMSGNPMVDKLIEATVMRVRDGGGAGGVKDLLSLIAVMKELGFAGGAQQSPFAVLKELKEGLGIDVAGMMKGGGKGDWRSTLAENAPSLIEGAVGILDKFAALQRQNFEIALATHRQRAADARVAAPPAPAPAAPMLAGAPAAVSPDTLAAESPLPPGFGAEAPAAAPPGAPVPSNEFDFDKLRHLILRQFRSNHAGDFVADLMMEMWPEQIPIFRTFLGKPKELIEQAKGDPVLSQIATDPEFPQFVLELTRELAGEDPEDPAQE